jgi:predicted MPP superfamily phosphohydrolase
MLEEMVPVIILPATETVLFHEGKSDRNIWRENRRLIEKGKGRSTPVGPRSESMLFYCRGFVMATLRHSGLCARGRRNALSVRMKTVEIAFPSLPQVFDGYTILHLTDTHFAILPELTQIAAKMLMSVKIDLVALTGDYQYFGSPSAEQTARTLGELLAVPQIRDGIVAVLGNHDRHEMVEALEDEGVIVLVNEHAQIQRGGDYIRITGLDDVHNYYSEAALDALSQKEGGFKIALVHSPEMASHACLSRIDLYLAGHTHGGQVCLPGGRPIFTALDTHQSYAKDLWRCDHTIGYTSRGLGVGGIPFRLNCPGEMTLIRLRREEVPKKP